MVGVKVEVDWRNILQSPVYVRNYIPETIYPNSVVAEDMVAIWANSTLV